jgi:hypothetical protein
MPKAAELPNDVEALKSIVLEGGAKLGVECLIPNIQRCPFGQGTTVPVAPPRIREVSILLAGVAESRGVTATGDAPSGAARRLR